MSIAPLRRVEDADLPDPQAPAAAAPSARHRLAEVVEVPREPHAGRTAAPLPEDLRDLRSRLASAVTGWFEGYGIAAALAVGSLGGLVLFWYLATRWRVDLYVRFTNIPTPAEVWQSVLQAGSNGKFLTNIGFSLRRIVLGFALAMLLGVSIGMLIGRYRRLRELLFPAAEALRPIPAIAWVPISVMLWPDNEVSIVFITFVGAFFPILLNTISGVQAVDAVLLRAGQCLGADERRLMWHVVLPGAAPQIFTGLAVGMGVAWVSLIAAEMISGQFGIGYFTWEAYSLIAYADIVLGMITIGVLGLLCSWLIRLAGQMLMPWLEFSKQEVRT
jgi:NitT/TauT family transport system permease protein